MNLLSDQEIWQEVEDSLLQDPSLEFFETAEEKEIAESFIDLALDQPAADLALAAFEANTNAKFSDYGWYEVKDLLLRKFVARAVESPKGIVTWGVGYDEDGACVLYVDLIGYGQASFHVFWSDEDLEGVPDYPLTWTGIRNESELVFQQVSVLESLQAEGGPGEVHNLLVKAGLEPWAGV